MYRRIYEDLFQIKPGRYSCQCYLITADINILIDCGSASDVKFLEEELLHIGLKLKDVDLVINTHEHLDHTGGNYVFRRVAAHKLAAAKLTFGDEEVFMCRSKDKELKRTKIDFWISEGCCIDAGSWFLEFLYTPGHTSGCICVYEPKRKFLFSGDTILPAAAPNLKSKSSNLAEYLNSLRTLKGLKINLLLPGHGRTVRSVAECIEENIKYISTTLNV